MNHIIALSGGKDSTAMAIRLSEIEPRSYIYVCTPTGDELPEMTQHLDKLEHILNSKIIRINAGYNLKTLCENHKALPNWRMRFCTKELKIIPYQSWIMSNLPAVSYVGLRADETGRSGVEWDNELLLSTRYPLREWGWNIADVLQYLDSKNIAIPTRTDCARCFYQTLYEWYSLWKYYPDIYADAEQQEKQFGYTFRSPQRDTRPAGLKELRNQFELGYIPKQRQRKGGCRICSM